MRVLIIEDSSFTRRKLTALLEADGHEVSEASNGREGLSRIQEQTPDCIILDLLMPVMDGLEVLETLQQQDSSVPVLVLSADVQESARTRCLELGATTFLEKPAISECLLEAVHSLGVRQMAG